MGPGRVLEPELMDDPALEASAHRDALRALARINRLSLAAGRVWREVRRVHREHGRRVRVLDLACGGGDILVAVARRAARSGIPLQAEGWDISPRAVAVARHAAAAAGAEVAFSTSDALTAALPGDLDVLSCALFLHHLSETDAEALLRRVREASPRVFLLQDLRRSSVGCALAWLTLHTLVRSPVARVDGLRSVRAAFTPQEVGALAVAAGLEGARVRRVWPQRFELRWSGRR
ncbi:MAG: methyltransferase domain-containing protein [Gemmatimonadota bacterium]